MNLHDQVFAHYASVVLACLARPAYGPGADGAGERAAVLDAIEFITARREYEFLGRAAMLLVLERLRAETLARRAVLVESAAALLRKRDGVPPAEATSDALVAAELARRADARLADGGEITEAPRTAGAAGIARQVNWH